MPWARSPALSSAVKAARPRRRSSTSRVIDRPIRPLFPKDMRNDVSVVCTVMSVDPDCPPETTAMIGASISRLDFPDIPWEGPISGVIVGMVDGEYRHQPHRPSSSIKVSDMARDGCLDRFDLVAMIEAGADRGRPTKRCLTAIMFGHEANQKIVQFIKDIQSPKSASPRWTSPPTTPRSRDVRGGQGFRH